MKTKNTIWVALVLTGGLIAACSDDSYIATNNQNVGGNGTAGDSAGGFAGAGGSGATAGSGMAGTAGAIGPGGAAGGGGECTPGETQTVGTCEKCGTSTRTCDANGNFGDPVCESQGACAAGDNVEQWLFRSVRRKEVWQRLQVERLRAEDGREVLVQSRKQLPMLRHGQVAILQWRHM